MKLKNAVSVLLIIGLSACLRVAPPETPNQRAIRHELERRDDRRHSQSDGEVAEPTPAIVR